MWIKYKLNKSKALEVLLYVSKKASNMYNALKVLYFADKKHLERYGRLIYGDNYVAMRRGPVPSFAYDLVKQIRGDGSPVAPEVEECLSIDQEHNITPQREAHLDLLSKSDIECLDEAIAEYGSLPFEELQRISHKDEAFQSADENDFMPLETIAESLPSSDSLLEYLRDG